jgi:hypothetical protein
VVLAIAEVDGNKNMYAVIDEEEKHDLNFRGCEVRGSEQEEECDDLKSGDSVPTNIIVSSCPASIDPNQRSPYDARSNRPFESRAILPEF